MPHLRLFALSLLLAGTALSCTSTTETTTPTNPKRIGNKNTHVFHTLDCRYGSTLTNSETFETREAAIAAGYTPDASGACQP